MLLGLAVAVLPVTLYNAHRSGALIPINSNDSYTFLAGNNRFAQGIYALPPGHPDGVLNEREVEIEMARRALGRDPTLGEVRRYTYRQARSELLASPWRR